jgi:hypothetical protein
MKKKPIISFHFYLRRDGTPELVVKTRDATKKDFLMIWLSGSLLAHAASIETLEQVEKRCIGGVLKQLGEAFEEEGKADE